MFLGISSSVLSSFSKGFRPLEEILCTGAWVLSTFFLEMGARRLVFVRRHVGFKHFYRFLCAGAWVLKTFVLRDSTFVHRRVGFKHFYVQGCNFCAQARVF